MDRDNIVEGFCAVLEKKASNYPRNVGESAWGKRRIRISMKTAISDHDKFRITTAPQPHH